MATIGIDLGTTNSLAVTYREGEVELIDVAGADLVLHLREPAEVGVLVPGETHVGELKGA